MIKNKITPFVRVLFCADGLYSPLIGIHATAAEAAPSMMLRNAPNPGEPAPSSMLARIMVNVSAKTAARPLMAEIQIFETKFSLPVILIAAIVAATVNRIKAVYPRYL